MKPKPGQYWEHKHLSNRVVKVSFARPIWKKEPSLEVVGFRSVNIDICMDGMEVTKERIHMFPIKAFLEIFKPLPKLKQKLLIKESYNESQDSL